MKKKLFTMLHCSSPPERVLQYFSPPSRGMTTHHSLIERLKTGMCCNEIHDIQAH